MVKYRQKSSLFASLPAELKQSIKSSALIASASIASTSASVPAKRPLSPVHSSTLDQPGDSGSGPVVKRRKAWNEQEAGSNGMPLHHPWDCQGMVVRYTKEKKVPKDLKKYYAQRTRLFALYNELPLLMDHEGWYSVTPERIAIQIAERLRCGTVLDAFCGVGGNSIAFAQTCERVIALDTSPLRLSLARHNALHYGVADRIEFILCDFVTFARSLSSSSSSSNPSSSKSKPLNGIDVVFLSPPWGGIEYLSMTGSGPVPPGCKPTIDQPSPTEVEAEITLKEATEVVGEGDRDPPIYPLSALKPLHGRELFELARGITQDVAYYLPKNTSLEELSALADPAESIEIEEEWMGGKLKALTVLYGSLAAPRPDLG
ncbi:Methylase [Phaffia rhodozyma]|uniref:Trimethylguanosine synthase n=1 Tax=Phaffia rhodozyma TaxID=264483 RepID=A0A0F7SMS2_PHARH|nr:Methylase [Phaffia rhodozyma]